MMSDTTAYSNYKHRKYSNNDDEPNFKKMTTDVSEIEKRLESLITRVGDKTTTSLESKLEGLTRVLDADFNLYKAKIINIISECVIKSPEKISIYSTLVGLLNVKNNDAGNEIVEHLVKKLKESLKFCNFEASLCIVNFFADLINVNVLPLSSLTNLFENFLEVTQENNCPQVRKDWFIYVILTCLPYMGKEFKIKKEHDLKKLMSRIENYISKRNKTYVKLFEVWSLHKSIPNQPEYLENFWKIIKHMFTNPTLDDTQMTSPTTEEGDLKDVVAPNLYNPHFTPNIPVYVAFENELSQSLHHNLPTIIPPIYHPSHNYPLPKIAFALFEKLDIPEGYNWPAVDTLEKWSIERDIHAIIDVNKNDKKACAAHLLNYRMKNKIPLNYMIVECMFAELFNLPSAYHIEIMYTALFIELCKLQPSSLPPVLAQATEIIFERLDYMNVIAADRFMDWFSHHISNFQFKWSWEDWESCVDQDPDMPQPKFITESLVKCIRLSYYDRICVLLTDPLKIFLPPKNEPTYRFEYQDLQEQRPLNELQILARSVMDAIVRKDDSNKIEETLRDNSFSLSESVKQNFLTASIYESDKADATNYLEKLITFDQIDMNDEEENSDIAIFGNHTPLKIAIFIQTILHFGNKSFSHSFSIIAKHFSLIKRISDIEDYQYIILRSVFDYWKNNSQYVFILIDKMVKTQLLNPKYVCNWVFSEEMAPEFTKFYVWDEIVIKSCLNRLSRRINVIENEFKRAERSVLSNTERLNDMDLEDVAEDEERLEKNFSPEDLAILQEKLELVKNEQKQIFLIIFQRFIIALSEYLVKCDNDGMTYEAPWFKYTIGRLEQIFLKYHRQISSPDIKNPLESLLFTSDIDDRITIIYKRVCSLVE